MQDLPADRIQVLRKRVGGFLQLWLLEPPIRNSVGLRKKKVTMEYVCTIVQFQLHGRSTEWKEGRNSDRDLEVILYWGDHGLSETGTQKLSAFQSVKELGKFVPVLKVRLGCLLHAWMSSILFFPVGKVTFEILWANIENLMLSSKRQNRRILKSSENTGNRMEAVWRVLPWASTGLDRTHALRPATHWTMDLGVLVKSKRLF